MIAWVRRALPQAERCELPGIGHYPQLEAAEEVAAWIGDTAARWG
jgi:pimeloyl-ACP methyl ester carboxylesterase